MKTKCWSECVRRVERHKLQKHSRAWIQSRISWSSASSIERRGQGNLRSLDDEALLVMIRMVDRDSSPGDDKIKFVFEDEADETSCIASKTRAPRKRTKVALTMVRLAQTFREAKGPKLD